MGQGHYTALVWGVLGDEADLVYETDEDGDRDIAKWANPAIGGWGKGAYVDKSYESETPWLGVMAGCTDGVLAGRRKGAADLEYAAMSLGDVASAYAPSVAIAREKWEEFRKLASANGVTLPQGGLLLVFDYH